VPAAAVVALRGLVGHGGRRFSGPEICQVVGILSEERWGEPRSKRISDRRKKTRIGVHFS
jgi:hypothetical protein